MTEVNWGGPKESEVAGPIDKYYGLDVYRSEQNTSIAEEVIVFGPDEKGRLTVIDSPDGGYHQRIRTVYKDSPAQSTIS